MKGRNKGISLSYIYFIVNTILSIIVSALVVRSVGQTNYGVYQTISAFVAYLVLLEFGTGMLMTRNLSLLKKDGSDEDTVNKNISTVWTLTVILSVLIALVAVVFYCLIGTIYAGSLTASQISVAKTLFIFVAIQLVFTFLTQTLNGLLIGYEFYTFEKIVSIIRVIIRSVIICLMMFISPNILIIVIVDTVISFVIFVITLYFCVFKIKVKLVFKYFDKSIFRFIVPFCCAMLMQTIVTTVNGSVDKFLISIMMTPDDVSIYAISMTIFSLYSAVGCIPVTIYMPRVAQDMKKGLGGKDLTESLIQPCRLNTLILGVLAFGFFAFGQQFLVIVYGDVFAESWIFALIVIFPTFINMFNGVALNIIDVLNKRHIRSIFMAITTAINILMTILGIKFYGMIGAAVSTGVSLILQTILMNIYYKVKINLSIGKMVYESFKGILPCLLFATIPAFIVRYLDVGVILQLIIGGCVFVLIFAILFCIFGANDEEKKFIKIITKRIKNKIKHEV